MNLNIHLDVCTGSVTFMSLIEFKLSVIFIYNYFYSYCEFKLFLKFYAGMSLAR